MLPWWREQCVLHCALLSSRENICKIKKNVPPVPSKKMYRPFLSRKKSHTVRSRREKLYSPSRPVMTTLIYRPVPSINKKVIALYRPVPSHPGNYNFHYFPVPNRRVFIFFPAKYVKTVLPPRPVSNIISHEKPCNFAGCFGIENVLTTIKNVTWYQVARCPCLFLSSLNIHS